MEKEKKELIEKLFNSKYHMSSTIASNLKPLTYINKDALVRYIELIDFVLDLGWIEHTSDWDPYVLIVLKNGEEIYDYYSIEIKDKTIELHSTYDNEKDIEREKTFAFKIEDIKSFEVCFET